ncbi:MAG: hypothetical protein AB1576_09625, partial [Bacillota bacterium]
MNVVRVGSVQSEVAESSTHGVLRMLEEHAEAARTLGVKFLCFPEYCLVGLLTAGDSAVIYAFLCYSNPMKLSEWAKQNGVRYQTAWRWFK